MAKYGSNSAVLALIDGYSIAGVLTEFSDDTEALTEDTTCLGETWETHGSLSVKRVVLTQNGFYDDAAGSVHEALEAGNGASRVVTLGYEGNTIGQDFVGLAGPLQTRYRRSPAVKGFHKATAEYVANGQREDGKILHALGAETADDDTEASSVDNSASSANGGAGYLQVTNLDLDGYDDITVKVRHSADNATFADLLTFAAATAHPDAERKAVAGTVNRYLASSWAFSGSGTSPTCTFLVGFARN